MSKPTEQIEPQRLMALLAMLELSLNEVYSDSRTENRSKWTTEGKTVQDLILAYSGCMKLTEEEFKKFSGMTVEEVIKAIDTRK